MGKSYEREGFFGKYTEHYDDDGNKIGESREREGFFGKYAEHTDADGNKIGESRDREGFFGAYTEHIDTSGRKIGESRDQEGFFGSYTEHTDGSGRKTGESREREGFFGNYTDHEGSGHHGGESKGDSSPTSWCFITTACVRAKGLHDNCKELIALRQFRDGYVASLPEGPELIAEYYRIAPAIVSKLDGAVNSDRLYEEIFQQLKMIIEHIEAKRHCKALYMYRKMVNVLSERLVFAKTKGNALDA